MPCMMLNSVKQRGSSEVNHFGDYRYNGYCDNNYYQIYCLNYRLISGKLDSEIRNQKKRVLVAGNTSLV